VVTQVKDEKLGGVNGGEKGGEAEIRFINRLVSMELVNLVREEYQTKRLRES